MNNSIQRFVAFIVLKKFKLLKIKKKELMEAIGITWIFAKKCETMDMTKK